MKIKFIEIVNFRKLKSVQIGVSEKTTVFVGANNSGKTSAMLALRYFLVERERGRFSLNDFTLSHWPLINQMGKEWEQAKKDNQPLPQPTWEETLPFLDVWLNAEKCEAYLVQKLIPTLDWNGGLLGVRLRLEPKDASKLQRDYLTAWEEASLINQANQSNDRVDTVIWPRSLSEYLQRRFGGAFTVKSYILDPDKVTEPQHGIAKPQSLVDGAVPIEGEPFKGLIRLDEINAQRGFGQADSATGPDDNGILAGSSATRRMSDQLRRYWNKHLDPFEKPDSKDIEALTAIEQAQQAFDERLRAGFSSALQEVEGMGYPGIADPKLKISSRLRPVDGLNHDAAVQYVIPSSNKEKDIELSLPEDSNGLGYQNLISMIFRLMSFRDAWVQVGKAANKSVDTSGDIIPPLHLVLIEEPEAHLHTQVQQVFIRQAYKVLRKHESLEDSTTLHTQLIISTHSNHIAHECEFDHLRYFRRLPPQNGYIPISSVINLGFAFGSDEETKRFVTRYIKATHCDLFFADAAIFIEGPAERILVPFFIRHNTELTSLHESYVTWLEIGGSHSHRLRPLIEHLGLTTLIITDLDAKTPAGEKAIPQRNKELKTQNHTLKTWCPGKENLDELLDLENENKIILYKDQHFSVRVAYQCPVEIEFKGTNEEVLCNTFEDALVMENHELFPEQEGTGLWKKFKSNIEDSSNVKDLSESVLKALENGGKAEFALNLLELECPKKLKPPPYILEGLKWLLTELNKQQKDLGILKTNIKNNENPEELS